MTNVAFVALATGLIIGLGAIGACIGMPASASASWAASTSRPQRASPS